MNDFVWTRPGLWPLLLALPVVAAALWAVFDRTRAAAARYGAVPTTKAPSPLVRALRTTALLGLALVAW
ncbi:MAG: hypothetical protein ACK6D1_18280, partial [Planctomycetota bacterium]